MTNVNDAVGVVEVVVGVIQRPDGKVLLNARPEGKPYAGWWEFPGGKIEPGETPHAALARELGEELGLVLRSSETWFVTEAVYPHAHVRLHFRRSRDFEGEPSGLEHQAWGWFDDGDSTPGDVLPASVPVLARVWMPEVLTAENAARWKGVCVTDLSLKERIETDADYLVVEEDLAEALAAERTLEPPLPLYVRLSPKERDGRGTDASAQQKDRLQRWRALGVSGIFEA